MGCICLVKKIRCFFDMQVKRIEGINGSKFNFASECARRVAHRISSIFK